MRCETFLATNYTNLHEFLLHETILLILKSSKSWFRQIAATQFRQFTLPSNNRRSHPSPIHIPLYPHHCRNRTMHRIFLA